MNCQHPLGPPKSKRTPGKYLHLSDFPKTLIDTKKNDTRKQSHQNVEYFSKHGNTCLPIKFQFSSVQFSHSVVTILCGPMNRSTPGLPVHHQLPEFTQTHVHRVSDAIEPSHPLLSPSPPAPKCLPALESKVEP